EGDAAAGRALAAKSGQGCRTRTTDRPVCRGDRETPARTGERRVPLAGGGVPREPFRTGTRHGRAGIGGKTRSRARSIALQPPVLCGIGRITGVGTRAPAASPGDDRTRGREEE